MCANLPAFRSTVAISFAMIPVICVLNQFLLICGLSIALVLQQSFELC
jgi:hypothetical protein